jgi:cytochrome P450
VLDLFSRDVRRDPFELYDRIRAVSPVLHDPEADRYMLFDYDSVKLALSDANSFSSQASPPGSTPATWLIFQDPPRHSKLRALIAKAFTARTVAALEPRIGALADGLLERLAGRDAIDLAADFAVPLPIMVIAALLGAPVDEWPRFKGWGDAILAIAHTLSAGPARERAIAGFVSAHAEMREAVDDLLARRRADPRDDLLTALAFASIDGEKLADDEILAFFELLMFAGHETTTNLLNNAIVCFADHPEALAAVRDAPDRLPKAIEEVLRFRTPVQAMFRLTREDVSLGQVRIPAGKLVIPMIGSANRDPARFADASRFDITRDPNPHVAFGHGIHACIGAALARLEARVALGRLLQRWDGFALREAKWEPRSAFHVHGPSSLPLEVRWAA